MKFSSFASRFSFNVVDTKSYEETGRQQKRGTGLRLRERKLLEPGRSCMERVGTSKNKDLLGERQTARERERDSIGK